MGCSLSGNADLIERLTESPFFCLENADNNNNNATSHLSSLSKRFTKRRYAANQSLWQKGDTQSTFNIIIQGEVRLQFKEDSDKQMVIISKTKGQCFGFDALQYNNDKIVYNSIAVTDLILYQLSSYDLHRYFRLNTDSYNLFQSSHIIPISNYLQSINVFSSINKHNACLLASMFRWKKIKKNQILFHEGTLGEEFYVVAKGSVAVVVTIAKSENYSMKLNDNNDEIMLGGAQLSMLDPEKLKTIRDENGNTADLHTNTHENDIEHTQTAAKQDDTRIVYEFKNGDYFGEVSLVIKIPRTATIKAMQDTTLLELRKSDFQKFIPDNSQIKIELEKVAHERIAQSFRRYKIPLFNAVPLDMFHILSRLSLIKYYKKGDVICDAQSKQRALYVIAHGNVGVYVTKQRITKKQTETAQITNITVTNDDAIKEKPAQKRISKHLLPNNIHLIASMAQREKLNRELMRLSFISQQAVDNNKNKEPPTGNDDEGSSSSPSQSPVPNANNLSKVKPAENNPITPPPNVKEERIANLNINLNANTTRQQSKTSTPSHVRFHTALDTPIQNKKAVRPDLDTKRRNSENINVKMSNLNIHSPMSANRAYRIHFELERKEKFVRIAELMKPDENIERLRNQSRRTSRISNYSLFDGESRFRTESVYSISGKTNNDATNTLVVPLIQEMVKCDPSDPASFGNFGGVHLHSRRNTHSQLADMIERQEKEHELKGSAGGEPESLIQYQSSSEKASIVAEESEEKSDMKQEERDGMKLRDFKSADGSITYTEIEVSVLQTGNFFGETSLMQEADENASQDSAGYEELGQNTPTAPETPESPQLQHKPSIYDILNQQNGSMPTKISRAKTAPLMTSKGGSGNKLDSTRIAYRGSHTTFRCVTGCVIYSIDKESLDEFFRLVPSARRWFDIMLSKYNVSLDTVLHIPRAARYFTLFLESEYAQENIHYVLSVNEYKEAFDCIDYVSRVEMANIICKHFISVDGKQQINVSYRQRKLILDKIAMGGDDNIQKNMFDLTQNAIYILLERDCFPRFKQSHFFHEFLKEAENLALATKEEYEKEIKEEEAYINIKHKESQLFHIKHTNNSHQAQYSNGYDHGIKIKRAITVV